MQPSRKSRPETPDSARSINRADSGTGPGGVPELANLRSRGFVRLTERYRLAGNEARSDAGPARRISESRLIHPRRPNQPAHDRAGEVISPEVTYDDYDRAGRAGVLVNWENSVLQLRPGARRRVPAMTRFYPSSAHSHTTRAMCGPRAASRRQKLFIP